MPKVILDLLKKIILLEIRDEKHLDKKKLRINSYSMSKLLRN